MMGIRNRLKKIPSGNLIIKLQLCKTACLYDLHEFTYDEYSINLPRLCQISKEYTLGRYQVASNHVPLSSCPFIAGFIPMLAGHRIKPDPYLKKHSI